MTVRRAAHRATAAYGVCLALRDDPSDAGLAARTKLSTKRAHRDQFKMALDQMQAAVAQLPRQATRRRLRRAANCATRMSRSAKPSDATASNLPRNPGEKTNRREAQRPHPLQRGLLACVDWAPRSRRFSWRTMPGCHHVWVDETRPRNQGASLTAWELNSTACRIPSSSITRAAISCSTAGRSCHVGTTAPPRRAMLPQDRHLPQGARRARQRRAVLRRAAEFHHRLDDPRRPQGNPIENGARRKSRTTRQNGGRALAEIQVTPDGSPAGNYGFDVTRAPCHALITRRASVPRAKRLEGIVRKITIHWPQRTQRRKRRSLRNPFSNNPSS